MLGCGLRLRSLGSTSKLPKPNKSRSLLHKRRLFFPLFSVMSCCFPLFSVVFRYFELGGRWERLWRRKENLKKHFCQVCTTCTRSALTVVHLQFRIPSVGVSWCPLVSVGVRWGGWGPRIDLNIDRLSIQNNHLNIDRKSSIF